MRAIRRLLDGLSSGSGGVVLVEGDPGIGKTRLLQTAMADAAERETEVLHARCRELEQDLPFAPLGAAAASEEPERAALADLLSGERLAAEGEGAHRARVVHAFTSFIEDACEHGPVLISVDDAQWADRATLLVLERIAQRCPHLPLAVMLTARTYPRSPALEGVFDSLRSLGASHLQLGPLEDEDVRQLVTAAVGARPGDRLMEAVSGAAGNPLFVNELLATLEQTGSLTREDGAVDAERVEVVRSLRLAILRRLAFLPERCLDVLRTASLLGSEFELRELAVVADAPVEELAETLHDAIGSNVLREAGPLLAFGHDLVREALYHDRPLAVREALHHEAARRLRAAGWPPLTVAAHLLRSATGGDRETIDLLRETADDCAHRDPAIAVELLERARALVPGNDTEAVDVKAQLAEALIWAGRWSEGERLARELADASGRPSASRQVLTTLVHASALSGILSGPVRDAVDAAADEDDLDPQARVLLLVTAAQAAFVVGDLAAARRRAAQGRDAALATGDQVRRCEALNILTSVAWHEARGEAGVDVAKEAVAVSRTFAPELSGDMQIPFTQLGMCLGLVGRVEEAVAALREGMELAERANNVFALGFLHQMFGVNQFMLGAFDAAEAELETAVSIWTEVEAPAWGMTSEAWLAQIAVHRGDINAARERVVKFDRDLPLGTPWSPARNVAIVGLARAILLEATGDAAGAFASLDDARNAVARAGAEYFEPANRSRAHPARACGRRGRRGPRDGGRTRRDRPPGADGHRTRPGIALPWSRRA